LQFFNIYFGKFEMKLSLRWIFDHIDGDWKKVDIVDLVDKFNKITAEIEGYEKFELDLAHFSLVILRSLEARDRQGERGDCSVTAYSPEWDKEITLSGRQDIKEGKLYLVKKEGDGVKWASLVDFGCPKDGLVSAVHVKDSEINGDWKKEFEWEDYIIEVDNKSITHRPDMWGHRGFAREVAAILGLPFIRDEDEFLKKLPVRQYQGYESNKDDSEFFIKVQNPEVGKRFSGVYVKSVENRSSSLWMASRLMRVGSRPIDFIVDVTNYVMLDTSQPMHAFDVDKLSQKVIEPRFAKSGEKLVLLDDSEIELTQKDYVITDGKKVVALAGVMGGKHSGIDDSTKSLFIESANFDAATIRNSAIRVKNRTEASSRFEKSLDPNQNIFGIFRLLKLFDDENIVYSSEEQILSVGPETDDLEIIISHEFIEKRLGAQVTSEFIKNVFDKLEFEHEEWGESQEYEYRLFVPTFRSTKDVTLKIDLVEEIGRFFGYENTDFVLPKKGTQPYDFSRVLCPRKLKKLLSFGIKMREVRNYSFYDESFLAKLNWEPKDYIPVANPVSENWKKLVTSLVPHLIKNVVNNVAKYDQLRFFEWARVWSCKDNLANPNDRTEKRTLSGIFYDKKIDFYCAKSWVNSIFELLSMQVSWEKVDLVKIKENYPWFFPYQTACIKCNGHMVGYAGKLDPAFVPDLFEGDAFAFELDGEFLLDYKPETKKLTPISKYPEVARDVSMFVSLSVTVAQVTDLIKSSSEKIKMAYLVDFFQKDDWKDKKSLTFRFIMQDYNKTLEKDEVDLIYNLVVSALQNVGADIR